MYSIFTVITLLLACAIYVESKAKIDIASTLKKFHIRGQEWQEAQKVINNLVDKSIANRVEEAEKDVERLLENNISDHIKKTGKAFLAGHPDSVCKDAMSHCRVLYKSGVCKTSKKAMKRHCAKTCGFCETQRLEHGPTVQFVLKPKIKPLAPLNKKKIISTKHSSPKKQKQPSKTVKGTSRSEVKPEGSDSTLHNGEVVIPEDTLKSLHSIEPLLLHHSKEAVEFSDNDIEKQTEKIHDAEKLLSDVKSLEAVKDNKEESAAVKSKVSKATAKITKTATKSKVSTKGISATSKAVPLKALSKTVTYKNRKYKITPLVDWGKINRMLKALGFKAVNLVANNPKLEGKHLTKHLTAHLKEKDKTGSKIIHINTKTPHVATETFVSAVHREKSYHNKEYFKKHCHPLCLVSCLSSCGEGCCKEHDTVPVKTALAKHCHPGCKMKCIPSCGSVCCSEDDEKKRGHHFLHYQRIHDFKNNVKNVPHVTVYKDKSKPKPKPKPKVKVKAEDIINQEEKVKNTKLKTKPLPHLGKHWSVGLYNSKGQLIPQERKCIAPCPQVCAPACAEECCKYGKYTQLAQSSEPVDQPPYNDPMAPNVPFPGHRNIPLQAYACKESCKFDCSLSCPRECCQPEAAAAVATEPEYSQSTLVPSTSQYLPIVQPYQSTANDQICPSPCPSSCLPSCSVGCCTDALGLPPPTPADKPQEDSPIARSSTRRVLHVTHVLSPLSKSSMDSYSACARSCGYHCSPVCARSGCCDKAKRSTRK